MTTPRVVPTQEDLPSLNELRAINAQLAMIKAQFGVIRAAAILFVLLTLISAIGGIFAVMKLTQ